MKKLYQSILVVLLISSHTLLSQCDSAYTYIDSLPGNVNILFGDSCFYNNDLDALSDLISENNLNYDSYLGVGTQSWFNGRLKILVAGNYGNSSGVNDTIFILPESIGNWTKLSGLYLEWNRISYLPQNFEKLKELRSLYISNNILEGLIENLDSLSNLKYLDLGYNKIDSIPSSMCELDDLQYLWLFNNNITSLPDCICSMNIDWSSDDNAWFPYFAIGGNSLCDNVPECIVNSENFNVSLDQFYYSFQVDSPQECNYAFLGEVRILPNNISLENPYPNPFNPRTNIKINVLKTEYVNISIFDLKGNLIHILNNKILEVGKYNFGWDASNVTSGIYIIRLNTSTETFIKKAILTK
ncbi:MAG: T9SS type A sorting domain-containing protein [Candidatus Neomarinimicrobiota bacterium]